MTAGSINGRRSYNQPCSLTKAEWAIISRWDDDMLAAEIAAELERPLDYVKQVISMYGRTSPSTDWKEAARLASAKLAAACAATGIIFR